MSDQRLIRDSRSLGLRDLPTASGGPVVPRFGVEYVKLRDPFVPGRSHSLDLVAPLGEELVHRPKINDRPA